VLFARFIILADHTTRTTGLTGPTSLKIIPSFNGEQVFLDDMPPRLMRHKSYCLTRIYAYSANSADFDWQKS